MGSALNIFDDVLNFAFGISEFVERRGNTLIDDLKIASSRKLLELHEREIWFDPGGITIHEKPNRPGRSDHGDLCVAITIKFSDLKSIFPILMRRH